MSTRDLVSNLEVQAWSDEEVVDRVLAGERALFEILMRRHNQRIYRVVRGILRDDSEAEDVMQDAYVRAYQYLSQFEGRSSFVTWLTRIAMHEAFVRAQRKNRQESLDSREHALAAGTDSRGGNSPEQSAANRELGEALEKAILALPSKYRSVLMMRDIEEMTTAEAADALEISEDAVKVRLHRARALVRRALYRQSGQCARQLFTFPATRCDRVVSAVLGRIGTL